MCCGRLVKHHRRHRLTQTKQMKGSPFKSSSASTSGSYVAAMAEKTRSWITASSSRAIRWLFSSRNGRSRAAATSSVARLTLTTSEPTSGRQMPSKDSAKFAMLVAHSLHLLEGQCLPCPALISFAVPGASRWVSSKQARLRQSGPSLTTRRPVGRLRRILPNLLSCSKMRMSSSRKSTEAYYPGGVRSTSLLRGLHAKASQGQRQGGRGTMGVQTSTSSFAPWYATSCFSQTFLMDTDQLLTAALIRGPTPSPLRRHRERQRYLIEAVAHCLLRPEPPRLCTTHRPYTPASGLQCPNWTTAGWPIWCPPVPREGHLSRNDEANGRESGLHCRAACAVARLQEGISRTVPYSVDEAISDLPPFDWANDSRSPPASSSRAYACPPKNSYQALLRRGAVTVTQHHTVTVSSINQERVAHIPPESKYNYLVLDSVPRLALHGALDNKSFIDRKNWFRRLDPHGHFDTVMTSINLQSVQGRIIHPQQNRVVTIRECARAQGFPDDVFFHAAASTTSEKGMAKEAHRQIGNAVPVPLARALGEEIVRAATRDHLQTMHL